MPPFIVTATETGHGARTRALLLRAGGITLMLWFLPPAAAAVGSVVETAFTTSNPWLKEPGVGGYVDLWFKRLHGLDLWSLFLSFGDGVLGVTVGAGLVLRRYRGPVWRGGAA